MVGGSACHSSQQAGIDPPRFLCPLALPPCLCLSCPPCPPPRSYRRHLQRQALCICGRHPDEHRPLAVAAGAPARGGHGRGKPCSRATECSPGADRARAGPDRCWISPTPTTVSPSGTRKSLEAIDSLTLLTGRPAGSLSPEHLKAVHGMSETDVQRLYRAMRVYTLVQCPSHPARETTGANGARA